LGSAEGGVIAKAGHCECSEACPNGVQPGGQSLAGVSLSLSKASILDSRFSILAPSVNRQLSTPNFTPVISASSPSVFAANAALCFGNTGSRRLV